MSVGDLRDFKVGDKVRVVGEFVIEEINDTLYGVQYVHTDEDGRQWGFIPGDSTKSMELIE